MIIKVWFDVWRGWFWSLDNASAPSHGPFEYEWQALADAEKVAQ